MSRALALLPLLLLLACDPVQIERGSTVEGGLSSVNEGIAIASGSRVSGHCRSVNGSIRLEDHCKAEGLSTVNGDIRVDADCELRGEVESVNGAVRLGPRTRLEGCIATVNGRIDLEEAQVSHELRTVNGNIRLRGSRVGGDILIKGKQKGNSHGTLVIELSEGSELKGGIRLEDPQRRVEVRCDSSSRIHGEVQGSLIRN